MTELASANLPAPTPTKLAQIINGLAARIVSEDFPTGERAALKRLDPGAPPPLAFYRFAFRHLPASWERQPSAWLTIVAGIALMCPRPHRPDHTAGQALAEVGYAEPRLERLLSAEGETLQTLVLRAARFLATKGETVNWTDFAYLLGIDGSPEKARLHIARHYYRHLKDNQKD